MALPIQQQARIWAAIAALTFVLLWLLGDVILPFLLGGALAYLLDPVADRLERLGLSRTWSVAVIALGVVLVFVAAVLLLIPTLIRQTSQLVQTAPELFSGLRDGLAARFPDLMDESSTIRGQLDAIGAGVQARGGEILNSVLTSAMGVINLLVLFVVVPVVAVYLLVDWDRMVARIDELLPREHAPTIRSLAREVDRTLASFVRGQGLVCLILGTYYAVALALVGLNFGLVVGAIAGLVTFIPYVGALVGGVLAIGLALFQFWGDWVWIGAVAGIFVTGQMIEGNILTPRLVGGSVGLHPVWLLFALAVFGTLFGFVGMLVAVPFAASLGVFARFAIARYQGSALYRGSAAAMPPPVSPPAGAPAETPPPEPAWRGN
ncbi:AI-2E family transporter [Limimaricola hongkongensis]|uniref:Putative permease often clustered with de novo purine synthesis n=1 Tax=Limimaricola hongkongensis DSM 17492 TaxID=1122180 RepID=A0A017H972_9RHOB|nr:AI-2E family transporter [Limimaricola hongkongensis]EYD71022.1 Putative permease often clustered with de novo purine synthesis [Limimaricola hongkongensis DSM 17492]